MTWVKLDDRYATHRKLLRAGPVAMALDIAGMCYSAGHGTDGFIPTESLIAAAPFLTHAKAKAAAAQLVTVGRWRKVEGGWQIHDFLDYNPSTADREKELAAGRDRAAASRARRAAKVQRSNGEPPPDVRHDDPERSATPSPSPSPSPDVIDLLARVGADPDEKTPQQQTGRQGKAYKRSRPPDVPRHRADPFVVARAREIAERDGQDAARAYLRKVDATYGQASRADQLARLEQIIAQDAAAEAPPTAHANLDDVIYDDDRPVHDIGTQGGRL